MELQYFRQIWSYLPLLQEYPLLHTVIFHHQHHFYLSEREWKIPQYKTEKLGRNHRSKVLVIKRISIYPLTNSFKNSNLFLNELMLICPTEMRLTL